MKTPKTYRLLRIFGWQLILSNHGMRTANRGHARRRLRYVNFEKAEGKCQWCGAELATHRYSMHSRLDASHPMSERYTFDNVIILCPKCNQEYQQRIALQKYFNAAPRDTEGS